jgi:hypothetical protein
VPTTCDSAIPQQSGQATMPTLFTDPRSGGVKKSSGVNVLPIVAEIWAQVRDDSNGDVDWLIASFAGNSKTDITVISSGSGGVEACASSLPENVACYGGVKLKNGRFATFYYIPDGCPVMMRGRGTIMSSIAFVVTDDYSFCLRILISSRLHYLPILICMIRSALLLSIYVQKW